MDYFHCRKQVKLSRPVQDESGYYTCPQNVILTPSIDGKFVNVMANTPNKLIMTEEFDECVDSVKYNEKKWINICKISGIIEYIYLIEISTNMIGIGRNIISSQKHLANQVKEYANNLMENIHSYLLYSCIAGQMEIHETKRPQQRYPNDSCTMIMAHSLYLSSSTQFKKIRKSLPFIFLPDVRTLYSLSEKNYIPLNIFFNSNKESAHTHLFRTAAHHLRNKHNNVFKKNEINNNNIVALHSDEINIATI